MARLFTKPVHDDIEIEISEHPDPSRDTENIPDNQSNNMTVSAKVKGKLNVKGKLASVWINLLSLPPQELVAELKVTVKMINYDNSVFSWFMITCPR